MTSPPQSPHEEKTGGFLRGLKALRRILIHEWPTAVFIAGLVGIAHAHFSWVEHIDAWALGSVARLGLPGISNTPPSGPSVWIYTIGEEHFRATYGRQSPLDRCKLEQDLKGIYAAIDAHNDFYELVMGSDATGDSPLHRSDELSAAKARQDAARLELLVIDLDLSPQPSDAGGRADEATCQASLDRFLISRLQGNGKRYPVHLVLMKPFDANGNDDAVLDEHAAIKDPTLDWMKGMEAAGAQFGDATFPVRADLAVTYYCDPQSLAAKAYFAVRGAGSNCVDRAASRILHARCEKAECIDEIRREHQEVIDPSEYGSTRIAFRDLPVQRAALGAVAKPDVKAVFVGVALDADNHPTTMGNLYGVHINAATFLSLIDPLSSDHHLVSFAVDVLIALSFGLLIRPCWRLYFDHRTHPDSPTKNSLAIVWLVCLGAGGLVILLVCSALASWLLRKGIWISPVPVGLGMLIDAAVLGSVVHVVHSRAATHETDVSFVSSLVRRFETTIVGPWTHGHRVAAVVELSCVAIWLAVVCYALLTH